MRDLIREAIVANYMDGDDGGIITAPADRMANDIADLVWAAIEDKIDKEKWDYGTEQWGYGYDSGLEAGRE